MADSDATPKDEAPLDRDPPAFDGGLESLVGHFGRRLNPGVDLDPVDDLQFDEDDRPTGAPPRRAMPIGAPPPTEQTRKPGLEPTAVEPPSRERPALQPTTHSPIAAEAEPPSRAARYDIHGEIARGGMGAIFKVRDKELRRSLAMKLLLGGTGSERAPGSPVSADHLNRFLEEAQVTAQLAHPGVVPVHELGVDASGRVYFTMNLVRGETLSAVIAKARAGEDGWTTARALQVIQRVCETMAFAHSKGVIHRDIKPANVMVGRFGQTYVMDWGLAKVLGRPDAHDIRLRDSPSTQIQSKRSESTDHDSPIMTMDGAVVGTPAYMPPEQAQGRVEEVDKRSDVYAIGALLYQLLTGETPYLRSGSRMSPHMVLVAVGMGPPQAVHEIDPTAPPELESICAKAMARDRDLRYASAAELGEDLQRFLTGRVVMAHRTGALIEMKKWVARNKAVAATAAAALLVVAAGAVTYAVNITAARDDATAAQARESERAREAEAAQRRAEAAQAAAERERDAKTEALRDSRALLLANASKHTARTSAVRALLLARAAVRTRETKVTVAALRAALAQPVESVGFAAHDGFVLGIVFAPDGESFITSSGDGSWRRWALDGEPLAVLQSPGHKQSAPVFSPDGSRILTQSSDGTARIWDRAGGRIGVLQHAAGEVVEAAYSADGSRILTRSVDHAARLWDDGGEPVAVLNAHSGRLNAASFSPDGARIVTASEDSTARIWDAQGTELAVLRGHGAPVRHALFSPDGEQVFTASADNSGRTWSLEGEQTGLLSPIEAPPVDPAANLLGWYSGDGSHILMGCEDRSLTLWRSDGQLITRFSPRWGPPMRAGFLPDGSRFFGIWRYSSGARVFNSRGTELAAIEAADHGVLEFSSDNAHMLVSGGIVLNSRGRELCRLRGDAGDAQWQWGGEFSPDGTRVVTGSSDGVVRVWDAPWTQGGVLGTDQGQMTSAVHSPDGSRVLSHGWREDCIWDPAGRRVRVLEEWRNSSVACEFSADGTHILRGNRDGKAHLLDANGDPVAALDVGLGRLKRCAYTAGGSRIVTITSKGIARVWSAAGELLSELNEATTPIADVVISRDGSLSCATLHKSGAGFENAVLFDAAGKEVARLGGPEERVSQVQLSADGSRLLTESRFADPNTWRTQLWDASGALVARLDSPERSVRNARFSPDGQRVLVACDDATTRLLDIDGRTVAVLRGHTAGIRRAAYCAAGTRILTVSDDRSARLWTSGGVELAALRIPDASISTARLSSDGTRIVTMSSDNAVRLWDLHGTELAVLRGHHDKIRSAQLSPDGSRVLTMSEGGTARLLFVHSADLLALADSRCYRDFTDAERAEFRGLLDEE